MTELKTQLTRHEVQQLCDLFNSMDSILNDVGETFDIGLGQLRVLRNASWDLRHLFNFRSQKSEENPSNPSHHLPQVLSDDDRAWYYTPDEQ